MNMQVKMNVLSKHMNIKSEHMNIESDTYEEYLESVEKSV